MTPFKNGEIDWKAFDSFVEWQIEKGTHGVVPCGTTGESPTLSHEEHMSIVKRCVDVVKKRIPVIAGSGSNSTKEAIDLTLAAKEAGADAALVVTPYYNKPTQAGMYAHYRAIHDSVALPIVIYNIPGRCIIDMSVETMADLAKLPHIVGVKDATGDLTRPLETRLAIGEDFCQLTGDDLTAAAFLAQGGVGCISVASNVAPEECAKMQEAWIAKDFATFNDLRDRLAPLSRHLFCESSPAPLKYAASKLGLCENEVRLPILPATKAAQEKIDYALEFAGILPANTKKAKSLSA